MSNVVCIKNLSFLHHSAKQFIAECPSARQVILQCGDGI